MNHATVILRIVLSLIFITHGLARLYYESVADFGAFLSLKGFPFGVLIAWVITIGEIMSGTLLALGKYMRYCIVFHALVILGGVFMVHLPNGWFVVGHGSGGVEYSLLILAVLFYLFSQAQKSERK